MLNTKVAKSNAVDGGEFEVVELGEVLLASLFWLRCVVELVCSLEGRGVRQAVVAKGAGAG